MHILICDNDKNYSLQCGEEITQVAKKNSIEVKIDFAESGENLLFFKDTKFAKVDLIYLDYHLPQLTGLEVAKKLRDNGVVADIVFYAEDESHAINGYDVEALHYIVKGNTLPEKFNEIFLKAAKRAERRHVEILTLSCAGEHRNIQTKDILYFEVRDRIVKIHYMEEGKEKTFEFFSSLSKIAEFLFGNDFLRIHSSYLIGTRFIKKKSTRQVELITGAILPVGRTYRDSMR